MIASARLGEGHAGGNVMSVTLPPDWGPIMQAGVMAPSADNHHCFTFAPGPVSIGLRGIPSHQNAPYHRTVLNRISIGAVVENMSIRAARLGWRAEAIHEPDPTDPQLIVEVRLDRDEPRDSGLDAAIAGRQTNRALVFKGPRLAAAELAAFSNLAADVGGVVLRFLDSGPERSLFLDLVSLAESERFRTRALHQELFESVRFDVGWSITATVGLPPATLAIEPGMRWAFSQLRRWPLMAALNRIGMYRLLGFRAAYLPCRLAPHCAVLSTDQPIEQGAFRVGAALERVWLEAQRRGLALQPLAASALLALPGYADVPRQTGERLRAGWRQLGIGVPLLAFRMGYASPPIVRTGRLPWIEMVCPRN
jgi:hypothetical protein